MAVEIRMPQLGLTMEEGTLDEWLKQEGDEVKIGEPIVQIQTDKLTSEVESEVDGVLLKIVAQEGEDIPVKGLLAYIGEPGEAVGVVDESATAVEEEAVVEAEVKVEETVVSLPARSGGRIKISPFARKTAKKMGIDFTNLIGTGPGGRIIQQDILKKAEEPTSPAAVAVAESATTQVGSIELMDGDTVVKLTGIRKTIAERMYKSHNEIPVVTQDVKIDVTKLMEFRKQLNASRETKLSVNDFILKAVAKVLKKNKNILVSLDGDKIIQRAHVNLGMAVSLDEGLIVPVIKDADKMGIEELSETAKDLAVRAREGKLNMDEYSGSTFTITNLGMYGVTSFTPIINQPDAAILGVNTIQIELDIDDEGNVFKKQVMTISLTFDHRLLDGSAAAVFQQGIKKFIEEPMNILL
ncbi:dihydrolipoamide acetyltransferase family protein [Cytobacillus kochii]|uniref:dihydrolipoamide acetyltransferase family protein n=1 Tax=Cytobacillus kochii TaxID=859143 RepID=UPI00204263E3|nr:dihydrolipoamide acetyltransferase family protein [Cytobacillus kochii]MCM3323556.1 2-oxo acid dehydrogenase subunit E2 [Cytobacillus kochii]MCM3345951.1 2-oxo acid dehydrogenase subunit E2 [Cytobacillus kochii]